MYDNIPYTIGHKIRQCPIPYAKKIGWFLTSPEADTSRYYIKWRDIHLLAIQKINGGASTLLLEGTEIPVFLMYNGIVDRRLPPSYSYD